MLQQIVQQYAEKFQRASNARDYASTLRLIDELTELLRTNRPAAEDILVHLTELYKQHAPPYSQIVFMAAWSNLTPAYSPILCKILDSEECQNIHEPALELLHEIGDPEAVSVLAKAITYRWNYDTWLHVPRKAIQALAAINTPEARAEIRAALTSPIEEIREEARSQLVETKLPQ